MVEQIKALFVPPAYPEDEDKARVAKLLHIILLALTILLSFNTVIAILLLQEVPAILINAATVVVTVALYITLHRGYVHLAAVLMVSLFWTAVTGVNFTITGFTIIIGSSYYVLVFLAGVLISKRASVIFAIMSILAAIVGYQLGIRGLLMAPSSSNPVVDVSSTASILLALAVVIYLNQQTLEQALDRSKRSQKALETYQAQLEERVVERTRDLALATEVGRTMQSMRNVDMLLTSAIRVIQAHFNLYFAQIYLVNEAENTLVLRAAEGQAAERLMRQGHYLTINMASINGRAAFEKRPLVVSNTAENPMFRPNPLLPFTRSEMAVPLKTAERVLGVLDLQSTQAGAFTEENLLVFEALAGQLSVALENAQFFTERQEATAALTQALAAAEAQTMHMAMVNEMANALESNPLDLKGVLGIADQYLQELIPSAFRSVALLNEDGETVTLIPLTQTQESPGGDLIFPLENSSIQRAVSEKRLVHFPEEVPFTAFMDTTMLAAQQMQSGMVAPLIIGSKVLGTLNLASERPSTYTQIDTNFILQLTNLLATHIESQHLKDRLQRLALLVETHPDLIGIISLTGQTTYLNASGLALLGLPPDADVSRVSYQDYFSEEDGRRFEQVGLATARANGIWDSQVTLHRADGSTVPVDVTVAPNYDASNKLIAYNVTLRDVTERAQAIEGQRQLTLQLEERLLQVNALQRTMTHEGWSQFLTSPSRLIQGYMYDNEQIRLLSKRDVVSGEIPHLVAEQSGENEAVMAAPMLVRGETIGVLGARNPSGEPLSSEQQDILTALSLEVAEALERARLFEETELAREQMNALYSGSERVVRAKSLDEVLQALIAATPLSRMDRADFLFFDRPWEEEEPELLTVTAVWEKGSSSSLTALTAVGIQIPITELPTVRRMTKDSPVIFLDMAGEQSDSEDLVWLKEKAGASSALFFPLVVGDQWFGILTAQSFRPITLSDDEIRQIISLTDQAASVSQTQQLFEQARDRARREQVLREVTARVYAATDAEAVLRTAVREVNRVLGLDTFIYLDENAADSPGSNGRHHAAEPAVLAPEQTEL